MRLVPGVGESGSATEFLAGGRLTEVAERVGGATVLANPFTAFLLDVETLRSANLTDEALVKLLAERLSQLNRAARWLPDDSRESSPEGYRQHLIHVAPDGGFSVCALVWESGQTTPIHNHSAWCVVGVYEGVERETRYRLEGRGDDRYLLPFAVRDMPAGEAAGFAPTGRDIHAVRNPGNRIAISIHVYGADLSKVGSSILHRFDDLPIREPAGAPAYSIG